MNHSWRRAKWQELQLRMSNSVCVCLCVSVKMQETWVRETVSCCFQNRERGSWRLAPVMIYWQLETKPCREGFSVCPLLSGVVSVNWSWVLLLLMNAYSLVFSHLYIPIIHVIFLDLITCYYSFSLSLSLSVTLTHTVCSHTQESVISRFLRAK